MANELIELGVLNAKVYLYEEFLKFEDFIMQSNMKILSANPKKKTMLEASCSAILEGASVPIDYALSLENDKDISTKDEWMVKGVMHAMNMPIPQSLDDLITMWKIVTDNCCDNMSVQGERFRTGDVFVGEHKMYPVDKLEDAMTQWFDIWSGPKLEEHPVIKQLVMHMLFECIHPFCDGNGRLGRLLLVNGLRRAELASIDYVSFSEQILNDPDPYYLAFNMYNEREMDFSFSASNLKNILHSAYDKTLEGL